MKVIEITEDKCTEMADLTEDMLTAGGKLMRCIASLRERTTDYRRSHSRMNYRRHDDREWDRDDDDMNMDRDRDYMESRYK